MCFSVISVLDRSEGPARVAAGSNSCPRHLSWRQSITCPSVRRGTEGLEHLCNRI